MCVISEIAPRNVYTQINKENACSNRQTQTHKTSLKTVCLSVWLPIWSRPGRPTLYICNLSVRLLAYRSVCPSPCLLVYLSACMHAFLFRIPARLFYPPV